ncbi:hypothetical protein [Asticcacaulis excentricus]|uniref:hypothetical protein n=1 Tax=Asticcacaulis excentricus TaxID=78587 RepID=UPI000F82F169|nr:hypothetical protein [Asticcacaulis excentricus]
MPSDPPSQRGNAALLAGQPIAFFCSQSCPGDLILKAQDWANSRGPDATPVVGGLQTTAERNVLRVLLRGGTPIIQVLAWALNEALVPATLRNAENAVRALIASSFTVSFCQNTARNADPRNRYILSFAAIILSAHASPGGKAETLATRAIARSIAIETLNSPANTNKVVLCALIGTVQ